MTPDTPAYGIRLALSYDGTDFAGWQLQPVDRTVQGELERALYRMLGVRTRVRGTSRTDSGVHAMVHYVAFDSPVEISMLGWVRGLNGKLPGDISVRAAEARPVGYDPRRDALGKRYRYLFQLAATGDPLWRRRSWHLGPRRCRPFRGERKQLRDWLDLDAMGEAATILVGKHDFRAFRAVGDQSKDSIRWIREMKLTENFLGVPGLLALEVEGNAFLQHMVRIVAGTLLDVGRGRLSIEQISDLLLPSAKRADAGETAPARGLHLVEISTGRLDLEESSMDHATES